MVRAVGNSKNFSILISLSLILSWNVAAAQSKPRLIPADGDHASLGRAFDTLTGQLVGFSNCIDEFKELSVGGPRTNVRLVEVTDQFSMMNALDIDVSAQGRIFGSSVSSKGRFITSVQATNNTQNFVIYARSARVKRIEASDFDKGIILRDHLLKTLLNNPQQFREKCGDSFVSAIHVGAEAYGLLSFTEHNRERRREIAAELNAGSDGWSASASAKHTVEEYRKSGRLNIIYKQDGGADPPENVDWESIKNSAARVAERAIGNHAVQVAYEVVPYSRSTVSNWQRVPLAQNPDLLNLIYFRGAYGTILQTLKPIFKDRGTARLRFLLDRGVTFDHLSELRKNVQQMRDEANRRISMCLDSSSDVSPKNCTSFSSDQGNLEHPYRILARLPLQFAPRIPEANQPSQRSPVEHFLSERDLRLEIMDRNILSTNDAVCEFRATQGFFSSCLLNRSQTKSNISG